MTSETFNPINFGFRWTADGTEFGWYEFNGKAAEIAAKTARDVRAKELKAQGFKVKKNRTGGQLMTRGGIGSGHPQIEEIVTVYGLTVFEVNS